MVIAGWFGSRVFQRQPWLKVRFSTFYFPSFWKSEGERMPLVIIWFWKKCASKKIVVIEKDHCALTLSHHPMHNCGQIIKNSAKNKNKTLSSLDKHRLLIEIFLKRTQLFHPDTFVAAIQCCRCCEERNPDKLQSVKSFVHLQTWLNDTSTVAWNLCQNRLEILKNCELNHAVFVTEWLRPF